MLIYNTTYQVAIDDARNFVIWLNECYIPEVENKDCFKVRALLTSSVIKKKTVNVFHCNGK